MRTRKPPPSVGAAAASTLSAITAPREDVDPEDASKAGREMKRLLSTCLRLVPDTSTTTYERPDVECEAWGTCWRRWICGTNTPPSRGSSIIIDVDWRRTRAGIESADGKGGGDVS